MSKPLKKPAKILSLFSVILIFLFGTINAQEEIGLPFLVNYSVDDYKAHTQNFSISQDDRGVMYFGNFSGILEYDGTLWRLIPTNNRTKVSALAKDNYGRIFVGTRGELGYLQADSTGKMIFISINHLIDDTISIFPDVKYLFTTNDGVYFIGDDFILLFNDGDIIIWKSKSQIKSAFHINDKLILDIQNKGLCYLNNEQIEIYGRGNYLPEATEIRAMLPLSNNIILIATANQGLFLLQDEELKPFETDADEYFEKNQITCASILSDSSIAFGTYRKGILIITPKGKIKQIINEDGGLQNENIKHLYIDKENNLWSAMNNGISMIESPSPLSYYDDKSQLNGGVTKLLRHNDILYAATYQGLYYYNPLVFSFEQIEGIFTSCWSIIPYNESIIAASSQGVFQVIDNTAKQITREFSLSVLNSGIDPSIIYVGQTEGFSFLQLQDDTWHTFEPGYNVNDEIRELIEDDHGFLWLNTSSSGIIKYDLSEKMAPEKFDKESGIPHLIGNNLSYVSGKIIVSSFETIYQFDYTSNTFKPSDLFVKDTSLYDKWIYEIVEDKDGNLWTNSGDEKGICQFKKNNNGYLEHTTPFLPIKDFVAWTIYPEDNGLIWFGGPDGLIRYDAKVYRDYKSEFYSLIRLANTSNDSILFYGTYFNDENIPDTTQNEFMIPVLTYEYSSINFEFSAVSYNYKDIRTYQYFLEGFDKIWSEWSTDNTKEYTSLPKGDYVFRVRSRNIYYTEGSEVVYSFVVKPAWYNTIVSYIIYILAAGFVVYLIVRMRSRQLVREKKALEGVIQERTAEIVQQKEEIEKQSMNLAFKNDELEKINQVVRSINSEIHFANLLNTMLEKTRVIKGVDKATALIHEKDRDKFRFRASFGWEIEKIGNVELTLDEAEERYLKYSEELFEDIFYKKKFKHFHDHDLLDKLEEPKSMIIIVIKVENKVEGFLILENMSKEDAFDEHDFSFLKNSKEHLISAFIKTKILQDLQNTLDNLQETQNQLVQSEKLASLGQLTAGIAHEIQNPLNFVNNFSSLSIDLAGELKEYVDKEKENIDKDTVLDIEEVIEMIESNVTKINEHGKRAERIVKGMLQHSRGSSGDFEATDLNSLVREYVNLAFHGMRAKDKSFNTAINTELDPAVGTIKIVPQDFSRVILNIINNGCYAVDQKKKKSENGYSPEVKVSTKKIGNKIEIRIRDNGTGMPQEVIDKIFNPFFTTKPTGQGTGLGLSMSFDIITQIHQGKLEVSSKDGEYTEFVITIPANL